MKTLALKTLAVCGLVAVLALPACNKSEKPDPAKYASICTEVVKCDAQTKSFPEPEKICAQFLANVEEKFPEKLPDLQKCINDQPCEQKNFAQCLAGIAQGMGGMATPAGN